MADEEDVVVAEVEEEETSGKQKKTTLVTAAAIIQKRFGRSIAPSGNKYKSLPESISSGSILLDNSMGPCKGYPFGSVIEVFGWEGAGKTLLLYLAIAEAQRKHPDKPCVLIDAERQFQFQAKWAASVGVNIEKLIVIPVSTAEEAFDIMHALILGEHEVDKKTNKVTKVISPGKYAIIGIDSVTQLVSTVDATKGMEESRQRGTQAVAIGLGLKKVTSAMARSDVDSKTILFFINQLRKNPNQRFGSPDYRTGGNALPFYDTIALKVAKVWDSTVRDDNGIILSHDVKVTFEKNKAGSMPEEAIVFTLRHNGSGVDNQKELFDVALMNGYLKEFEFTKDDGRVVIRYNFVNENGEKMYPDIKDFGKKKFEVILEENPKIKSKIQTLIEEKKIFVKKENVKEDVPESAMGSDEDEADAMTKTSVESESDADTETESESESSDESRSARRERKRLEREKKRSLRI
jgi:recombination protein RecA